MRRLCLASDRFDSLPHCLPHHAIRSGSTTLPHFDELELVRSTDGEAVEVRGTRWRRVSAGAPIACDPEP